MNWINKYIDWAFPKSSIPIHNSTQYLDGWRGIAIAAVLWGHFAFFPLINLGRVGVELFFVLSGRLMADILFVKKTELTLFFKRRITRVWQTMAIFLVITVLAANHLRLYPSIDWKMFLSTLTFTYNYYAVYVEREKVIDHIWSLCIEEHMYVIMALIAYVSRKRLNNQLPILLMLTIASIFIINGWIQSSLGYDYNAVYWRTDTRGASILMGAIAFLLWPQIYHKNKWARSSKLPWVMLAIGLLSSTKFCPDTIRYSFGTACFAIAMVSATNSKMIYKFLSNKYLVIMGLVSFSAYLWQQPFYALIQGVLDRPILLILAILTGLCSFWIIEKPTRNYLNKFWAKT